LSDGRSLIQAENQGKWLFLNQIEQLRDIAQGFDIIGDLETDLLAVLALGPNGWELLGEKLQGLEPQDTVCNELIPYHPASFRDFMLYEDHVVNSSRGYANRYLPRIARVIGLYERLTAKVFPAFRPAKLWYQQPIYYFSNHINIGTSGEPVRWPSYCRDLDYEFELAAILAHPLRNASLEEAANAIGGFVLLNDFSARDVQRPEMLSGFGPQKCKHFYSTISPVVLTADELLPRFNQLNGSVKINGKIVAECSSEGPKFSIAEAISHASQSEDLIPGELFGSGTLPGGAALENGNWLNDGDEIELNLESMTLITKVIREERSENY
jgi:2-keto-4-pentenoate hydratase/2-oxohepta-3-ene-1,7-dioic acid hydratase in catechol pathway